ncbi:MAG: hypothetical protein HGA45_44990, partial [Chloroflexales bacterium]|nr:hypothetical protein [Chloroflexales bacterium]
MATPRPARLSPTLSGFALVCLAHIGEGLEQLLIAAGADHQAQRPRCLEQPEHNLADGGDLDPPPKTVTSGRSRGKPRWVRTTPRSFGSAMAGLIGMPVTVIVAGSRACQLWTPPPADRHLNPEMIREIVAPPADQRDLLPQAELRLG